MDGLNLPTKSLKGKSVDLTVQAKALAEMLPEPKFRVMVIRAAVRLLRSRDVEPIIPKPEPLSKPPELGGNLPD